MLNKKQTKLLMLLDDQIMSCKNCPLWMGGYCKPFWTTNSKYGIIGEAPGSNEVNNEPFIGKAGKLLWKFVSDIGLSKDDFTIINSTNCRPVKNGGTNGKPQIYQCEECYDYIRKYFLITKPKKILLLGNYAVGTMTGDYAGIIKKNGTVFFSKIFNCNVVMSVHPSITIYKGAEGEKLLYYSLRVFKGI